MLQLQLNVRIPRINDYLCKNLELLLFIELYLTLIDLYKKK